MLAVFIRLLAYSVALFVVCLRIASYSSKSNAFSSGLNSIYVDTSLRKTAFLLCHWCLLWPWWLRQSCPLFPTLLWRSLCECLLSSIICCQVWKSSPSSSYISKKTSGQNYKIIKNQLLCKKSTTVVGI